MDLELRGKVALIVGAAGSMGQAMVSAFQGEGAHVLAADLPGRVQAPPEVVPLEIDVTREESVRAAVQACLTLHGRIDILVSLVGIYQARPIVEISPDDWDLLLSVNLKGSFLVAREVLPHMQQSDYGRMIFLASLAGQVGGVVSGAHYAASKAGVLSLVKSLAKQAREPWITVNAVSPGPVSGAMTDAWPEADRQKMIDAIPLRRFGRPEEIADLVLFLSSPKAAYIKGARVDINGGAHMD